jgi:hypothetical protein
MYTLARPTFSIAQPTRSTGEELDKLWLLTEGLPLLVACYNATRRPTGALPPGLPEPSGVASREGFEQWLATLISSPTLASSVSPASDLGRFTFVYSLAFLAAAPQGLSSLRICEQFEQRALPYDLEVIRWLSASPLVSAHKTLLVLHTDLLQLIDRCKSVSVGA